MVLAKTRSTFPEYGPTSKLPWLMCHALVTVSLGPLNLLQFLLTRSTLRQLLSQGLLPPVESFNSSWCSPGSSNPQSIQCSSRPQHSLLPPLCSHQPRRSSFVSDKNLSKIIDFIQFHFILCSLQYSVTKITDLFPVPSCIIQRWPSTRIMTFTSVKFMVISTHWLWYLRLQGTRWQTHWFQDQKKPLDNLLWFLLNYWLEIPSVDSRTDPIKTALPQKH